MWFVAFELRCRTLDYLLGLSGTIGVNVTLLLCLCVSLLMFGYFVDYLLVMMFGFEGLTTCCDWSCLYVFGFVFVC